MFRNENLPGVMAKMILPLCLMGCLLSDVARISVGALPVCPEIDITNESAVIESLNLEITCGGDSIVAKINTCALTELGYDVIEDVSFAGIDDDPREEGKICSPETNLDGNDFYITLRNFSDCETEVHTSGNNIKYYNAVRTVYFSDTKNQVIRRTRMLYMPFVCRYISKYNETTGGYQIDEGDVVIISMPNQIAPIELSLEICCDENCDITIHPGDEVGTGDLLYLIAQSSSTNPIEIVEFYATRKPGPSNYSERYYLAEEGCSFDFTTYVDSMVPFHAFVKFLMFNWEPDQDTDVYFHATAELCDPVEESCTEHPCDGPVRKKRANGVPNTSRRHIAFGPFTIKSSKRPSDNSGISQDSGE